MSPIEICHEYRKYLIPFRQNLEQREIVYDWLALNSRGVNKDRQYVPGLGKPQLVIERCNRDIANLRRAIRDLNAELAIGLQEAGIELDLEPVLALERDPIMSKQIEFARDFVLHTEEQLMALVTRDSMIGVARVPAP